MFSLKYKNVHWTQLMFKQVSNRGNTNPKWLIDIIKCKRRIQNGLRCLASDTRIKSENAYIQLLQLDSPSNLLTTLNTNTTNGLLIRHATKKKYTIWVERFSATNSKLKQKTGLKPFPN